MHLGAPKRAVPAMVEGLCVQDGGETLLRFDCFMLFAGPTGQFSSPWNLALSLQHQVSNTSSGLIPILSWGVRHCNISLGGMGGWEEGWG